MSNAQHTAVVDDGRNLSSKRYRNVTISVALFLALVSGLMYYAYRISEQIQKSQVQLDAAGTLSDTFYDILVVSQAMRLESLDYAAEAEDGGDDTEYVAAQVENQKLLEESRKTAQEVIGVLDKGGAYDVVEGFDSVASLGANLPRESLKKVQTIWRQYQPLIDGAVKYSVPSKETPAFADELAGFAAENQDTLYNSIDEIIVGLNDDITAKSTVLRNVQIAGIGTSVLYFLFFVNFFMRRLSRFDREIAIARRENQEILQTVNSGLFLLDKNLNIGSQYSSELERLWGKKDFGGQNMLSVLSDMVADSEDLETAGSFVRQLYNPRTKEKLIESLNPLARSPMSIVNPSGIRETRYLDFKFNRVYQNDEIARVLVSVSDATNAVMLEDKIVKEREQSDLQMEMLSFILKADAQLLSDFIETAKKRNNSINEVLKQPAYLQSDFFNKLRAIFREVHGLKGDASSLNLHGFVSIAERLEERLRDLQGRKTLNGEDFLTLTVSLEELFSLTQNIEDLNNRINHMTSESGNVSTRHANYRAANAEPVKNQLAKYVEELAVRNGKKVDFSCEGMDNQAFNMTIRSQLRELAVQLLRNAVVHGIETPENRIKQHKLDAGHIRLVLQEHEDSISLCVQDDGVGIKPELIRSKLIEKGMPAEEAAKLDSRALIQKIFMPGFSTAADSNEDAGRGVGMDIVSERIRQMKGKVSLATRADAYTRITVTVPKST